MIVETPNIACLRDRILEEARKLFHEHGYSKVSATEIAQAVGISKKTLYKEFETKEEILRQVIRPKLERSSADLEAILNDTSRSYLQRLGAVMELIGMQYQRVSQVLLRDVFIHAPEISAEIERFREQRFERLSELLRQGTAHGVFRSEIEPSIILALYKSAVDSLMQPAAIVELPCTPQQTFTMIFTILLQGILRDDAREEFVASTKVSG